MATAEERAYYSRRDPTLTKALEMMPIPVPMATPDQGLAEVREQERRARVANTKILASYFMDEDSSDFEQEEINIPVRNGFSIAARKYSPKTLPEAGSPLIMILHAGGFVLGGVENEHLPCRLYVKEFGAVVLNVMYRLAPEHPFPTAAEDAWDALKWTAENAGKLNATPSRGFIVGGTSAGGNLADVIGHLARNEKMNPPLTGLLEIEPPICPYPAMPERYKQYYTSHQDAEFAPLTPASTVRWFHHYNKPDLSSELFVPFNWPSGHKGLPPVAMHVCGDDLLRDGQLIYEKVLREEAGVKTRLKLYPGLPHNFHAYLPEFEASRTLIRDAVDSMRWLLDQKAPNA